MARTKLGELIANLPPCLIGMEACSAAHHWAREFSRFGQTVRMMVPKFIRPYRMSGKRGKNDAANAAAICEAVTTVASTGKTGGMYQASSARHNCVRWSHFYSNCVSDFYGRVERIEPQNEGNR